MRVLHCADSYLPQLGGIENQVHDLATQQRLAGDEVVVATTTRGGPDSSDGDPGVRLDVRRLPSPFRRGVGPFLDSVQPDLVHCHASVYTPFAWATARAAARRGVPTVVTLHSLMPAGAITDLFGRVGRALGPVTWTSVSSAAAACAQAALSRPVLLLPNGVSTQAWRPATGQLPPESGAPLIVAAQRLVSRKRTLPLLHALRQVADRTPDSDWRAVLVGDGPQGAAARRTVARLGLRDRVTMTGRMTRPELALLLSTSHIFLAPAYLESFGVAALEARCAGLAVVAMRGGGVSDFVVDGENGHLVADDAELATRVAELVVHRDRLRDIQQRNRSGVPPMDWVHVLPAVREVYAHAGAWDRGARVR